ncbi:MAG TPA: MarR family transcriptional regulator [Stellaceae bacterium]|nr:MarR family transcriptional regulator [Stellaceae bacterium]
MRAKAEARVLAPEDGYELEAQVGFLLRRAQQRHVAIFADCMGDIDLTPTQFSALVKLRDEGGVSQNRLGRLTAMDPSTILGVVHRLLQRNLVSRRPDPRDPRSALLTLTPAGAALVERAVERARAATEKTAEALTPAQRKELQRLLAKIAQ